MNCPKCGGPTWDNRPKKAEGQFKASAPDFKCKDKNCGGVIWPPRGDAPRKTVRQLDEEDDSWLDSPNDEPVPAPLAKRTVKHDVPDPVYWALFSDTVATLQKYYDDGALMFGGENIPVSLADILASVSTQYIQHCKKYGNG